MNPIDPTERYGRIAIGVHWLTLLLLVGVYTCIDLTDLYPKGSAARDALRMWHFMLGLTVLLLALLRLVNRLAATAPAIVPPLPAWQYQAARGMHLALYALMIGMPILGWLVLSASGKPIPFFGVQLPPLLAANKDLAGQLRDVHETIGTVGYFLIGGHALLALYHHFVRHDHTMLRMLPARH